MKDRKAVWDYRDYCDQLSVVFFRMISYTSCCKMLSSSVLYDENCLSRIFQRKKEIFNVLRGQKFAIGAMRDGGSNSRVSKIPSVCVSRLVECVPWCTMLEQDV